MAAPDEDEYYEVPLRDQRYFGAGIKRKRLKFVPSSSTEATVQSLPTTPSQSAADKYLSIVFNKNTPAERPTSAPPSENPTAVVKGGSETEHGTTDEQVGATCDICSQPVTSKDSAKTHESSIVHQICLQHSHPPSHLDRRRKGLAVLESQGWDPDSRRGLGAEGKGILHPIKAKDNPTRAGLGVDLTKPVKKVEKAETLDAGKVRLKEKEGKKKAQNVRDSFYRSEDMEKYLGTEGEMNGNLDMAAFKRSKRK